MRMNLSTDHIKYFDNGDFKIYNAVCRKDYKIDFHTTFSFNVGIDCIFWFNI